LTCDPRHESVIQLL